MRAVIQRVLEAGVVVVGGENRREVGAIGAGFLAMLGVHTDDTTADSTALADKIAGLRVFEDEEGKMNRSLLETGGSVLVVSNFTLYGDCRKGRRPSFTEAASGQAAESLYLAFTANLASRGVTVQTGVFGAKMEVRLINDGPITLLLDSRKLF